MIWRSLMLIAVCMFICGCNAVSFGNSAKLKVYDKPLHEIDVRLFGQFLERASFGEYGPEAFVDPETGKLPEKIVGMLKTMEIPVIRFPGGTDIDYIDWRDMISNVPGRKGPRPITKSPRPLTGKVTTITNHFGYDEYFALRDELGCETILVVNLLDGLAKQRTIKDAADMAAGLVAYANAAVGAKMPDGMPDWPAVRKANGHVEPFGAEYVQIGNEAFLKNFKEQVKKATGFESPEELGPWYVKVISAYIQAIRAVDSDIKIIIDAYMGKGVSDAVQADPYIKANVAMLTRHKYAPGGCNKIKKGDQEIDPATLSDSELWWAWVSMPGDVDDNGQNQSYGTTLDENFNRGYEMASTEWNWNGWSWQGLTESFEAPSAAGIGAAAFLQGLMRNGDKIKMANQSMLLGNGWAIAAIFGDPSGEHEPYYNPQGSSTTFYRKHHGSSMLDSELSGVKTHPQPYRFGWGGGVDKEVAELDVMVTANDDRVFIHVINRTFAKDLDLQLDLTDFGSVDSKATHHKLYFKLFGEKGYGFGRGMAQQVSEAITASKNMTVTMPARTVSILEIPLAVE